MALSIVEVGAGCYENLSGSGLEALERKHTVPRILIDQPDSQLKFNEYLANKKNLIKHAERTGMKHLDADIFETNATSQIPEMSVGLWALGNVVTDPAFFGNRDYEMLAENIARTTPKGGLVLFSSFEHDSSTFREIRHAFKPHFQSLLDEQTEHTHPIPEVKLRLLTEQLEPIGVIDDALVAALITNSWESWVVYQKK